MSEPITLSVDLEENMDIVVRAATEAVRSRMKIGAEKYHPGAWQVESVRRHVLRAIKHLATGLEVLEGEREPDGEDHLAAAVCRASMALAGQDQPEIVLSE
jgi:hypothetical protein